jgi:hypothetical protein
MLHRSASALWSLCRKLIRPLRLAIIITDLGPGITQTIRTENRLVPPLMRNQSASLKQLVGGRTLEAAARPIAPAGTAPAQRSIRAPKDSWSSGTSPPGTQPNPLPPFLPAGPRSSAKRPVAKHTSGNDRIRNSSESLHDCRKQFPVGKPAICRRARLFGTRNERRQ